MSEDQVAKPDQEADATIKSRVEPVSSVTDVTASRLDLRKAKLKTSREIVNPIINVGMERNEEDELTAGETRIKK